MSGRKILVFSLILLALAAFYYLYEVKVVGEREKTKKEAQRVFPFAKKEVRKILLKREGEQLEIAQEGEVWVILRPVHARGDQEVIGNLLEALTTAEKEKVFEEVGADALGAFGLSAPQVEVILQGEGREEALLLGRQNPSQTAVYAIKKGEERPFLMSLQAWIQLDKGLYDFRDKTILPFKLDQATGLEVYNQGTKVQLERDGDAWKFTSPVAAKAIEYPVTRLLKELTEGEVRRFVDEAPNDIRPYGLHAPQAEVWVDAEGKRGIRFGKTDKAKGWVYASVVGEKNIFFVDQSLLALLPREVIDWRDKRIFTFDLKQVSKISLGYQENEVVCEKAGPEAWEIASPQQYKADFHKIHIFLAEIQEIEAQSYVPYKSAQNEVYGLHAPREVVKIWSEGDEKPVTMIIGKSDARNMTFTHREGEEEVYVVAQASLETLKKSAKDFQYRKVFTFQPDTVKEIEIASFDKKIVLAKKGNIWQAKQPKGEIDEWKVNSFLWGLAELDYEDELTETGKLAFWGLAPPVYKVLLRLKGKDEVTLYIGKAVPEQSGKIYALNPADKKTYTITGDFPALVKQYFLESL